MVCTTTAEQKDFAHCVFTRHPMRARQISETRADNTSGDEADRARDRLAINNNINATKKSHLQAQNHNFASSANRRELIRNDKGDV